MVLGWREKEGGAQTARPHHNPVIEAARKLIESREGLTPEYMAAFRATLDIDPVGRDTPKRRPMTAAPAFGTRPMSVPSHPHPMDRISLNLDAPRPTSSPAVSPSRRRGRPAKPSNFKLDLSQLEPQPPPSPRGGNSPTPRSPRHCRAATARGERRKPYSSYLAQRVIDLDYYRVAVDSAKGREGSRPFAKWPFAAPAAAEEHAPDHREPPGEMGAPHAFSMEFGKLVLGWDALEGGISGYEIEVADIDALRGLQPWRKVHRGPGATCPCNFGRGTSGVRARVRAYNSKGKGPWSPASAILRLPNMPGPDRTELDELPGSWLTIDLAGLPEFDEKNDATFMSMAKDEVIAALFTHKAVIKVAFRYYALAGVANIDDDPSTMTMVQFGNFCRSAELLGPTLSASDIDRIFLRAVRTLPSGGGKGGADASAVSAPNLLSAMSTSGYKVSKEWKKVRAAVGVSSLLGKGKQEMSQAQFVGSLVRLAAAKFPEAQFSLGDKLNKLLGQTVHEHVFVDLNLVDDEFSAGKMRGHLMNAVLEAHARQLKAIFGAYAAADTHDTQARHTQSTMNVRECHELCEDVGCFDAAFTVRDLLIAFVKVNIDDDLYVQSEVGNTGTELVFEEFEEFVARVFKAAVWTQLSNMSNTANLLDQDGDGDLDDDDVDNLFAECDTDGSGSVSVEELQDALGRRLNAGAATAVAQQIAQMADEDGSGQISQNELRDAVRKIMSGSGGPDGGPGALERAFHTWLGSNFVPRAQKAIAKKRLHAAA